MCRRFWCIMKRSNALIVIRFSLDTNLSESWRRHNMETLSALLVFVRGIRRWISLTMPVMWNFDTFSVVGLNKLLNKQSIYWRFLTPWCSYIMVMMRSLSMEFLQNKCSSFIYSSRFGHPGEIFISFQMVWFSSGLQYQVCQKPTYFQHSPRNIHACMFC